jgi:hypothetical protein
MKKTVSPKQIEANRRNAQKSTGPKTAQGKAVSKMNAVKHGLLAQTVVVHGHKFKESEHEFKELCQEFYESLSPVGPLEKMLVDQIVTIAWRLRRVRMAETGEIALSVDKGWWERSRWPNPQLRWLLWQGAGDTVHNMGDSGIGNRLLAGWLREVREGVEKEGELTEAAVQKLVQSFGGKPNSLTRELEELRLKLQENPAGLDAAALRERNKKETLAFLDRKLRMLEWQRAECEEREDCEEEAHQAAAVLPSAEVLDKILRCETALVRHWYRAMNELERLQRRRQGENVPAPLSLEVSTKI